MKKLLVLIITMLSFSLIYFSFRDVNENQATNVYAFDIATRETLGSQEYFVNVLFDETHQFNEIVKKIGMFAQDNEATLIMSNSYKDNQGIYTIHDYYIISPDSKIFNNYLIEGEQLDFMNLSNQEFYSTADENSAGIIKILDNSYFDLSQDIFRFHQFNSIQELSQSIDNSIFFSIYSQDENIVEKLQTSINESFDNVVVDGTSHTVDQGYTMKDTHFIEENQNQFFEITIIIFIVILTVSIIKSTKKYMVKRMLGTSVVKIAYQEYFWLLTICQVLFSIVMTIAFYVLCPSQNKLTEQFYREIFPFHFYCLGILVIMFLLICVFIYLISHVKYLNSQNHYKHLFQIQIVMKVIMIIILMPILMSSIHDIAPYVNNYFIVSQVEKDIQDMYYLDNIPNKSEEIFNYYIDKVDYIDFNDYFSNSKLNSISSEDSILMQYPYIHANTHYMKQHEIRDENNQFIDFESIKENVLFVPLAYKGKDLSRYYPSVNNPIVYIQNTGDFVNMRMEIPFSVNNPIIYLENKYDPMDKNEWFSI